MSRITEPIHICFYSNKCQWSKAFLTELSTTPWKNQFRFVCVDPSPGRPPLPGWLKKVPTIVISGEPEPRTDTDVMNWLYEKKMKEGVSKPSNMGSVAEVDPMGFNVTEQGSFSKGFSYSGIEVDTSSTGSGGMTMPGAFSFLGGAAGEDDRLSQDVLGAAQPANSSNRRSKKEEMFDKQMASYQRDREMGMPKGPART
jgi:hypothetical protein